jgi:hypothetical protein
MFMIEYRSLIWWCWLVTAVALTVGVAGWPAAFVVAIATAVFQLLYFLKRGRSLAAFPVQVRIAYLLVLLVALPPVMQPLYWLPMLGTWLLVLFGYCLVARMVSLLPWNRTEPLSLKLLERVFISRPVRGNVLQGFPPA